MPEFSATLLALLGISAGTYVGFEGRGLRRSEREAGLSSKTLRRTIC
jgi:hypothetical protein